MASVNKAELVRALTAATRLAGQFSASGGVRGLVLVRLDEGGLTLTVAGDTPAQFTLPVAGLVMQPAQAVVPVALLGQLAGGAPTAEVELSIPSAYEVALSSGGFAVQAAHPGGDLGLAEQFHLPDAPEDALTVTLEASELVRGLSATLYAASKESFQAVFRGMNLTFTTDGVQIVSTDGYRVAVARLPASVTAEGQALVHRSHADELSRMLSRLAGPVALRLSTSHVIVRAPGLRLALPLMDGDFPDWRRTLPSSVTRLTLDTDALKEACARCALLTDSAQNHRVELHMAADRTVLELASENEYGRVREQATAQWEGTEPRTVAVNVAYLREAIAGMRGKLTLGFAKLGGPFTIESEAPGITALLVTLRA